MEQRPLRLGDIVDDYCPRERRLTNHAIVALVDDVIKQTRCTTCDHEHVYKQAREPRRRKKDQTEVLYSQVLSGLQKTPAGAVLNGQADEPHAEPEAPVAAAPTDVQDVDASLPATANGASAAHEAADDIVDDEADPNEPNGNVIGHDEPWSMHRRLIRAQLPRTGNEPPQSRPLPDFTIRQPGGRGGQRQWGRGGEPNGNTGHGRNGRGGHGGHGGHGQGGGHGHGGGQNRHRGGGRRGGQGHGGGRPGGGGRGRRSR